MRICHSCLISMENNNNEQQGCEGGMNSISNLGGGGSTGCGGCFEPAPNVSTLLN